ncbi:MAG: periplasmic sensor signal transduction histidine kinase [Candidatus Angelobacter sp.]|nr:periplasmic sensor signal transduction histidine kinase [Candidatus Angelobacter sp.]
MTRPQTRERLLRWVAVPALAAVLVGLAVLQYRWSRQVGDATRAQMLSSLRVSLVEFRQDFSRELGVAAVEIKAVADGPNNIKPAELNKQFHHLQQTAAHPNLFSHIFLWQDPTHQKPLRFDPASNQFERTSWPAEFGPMQQRLLEITTAHHPPGAGPDRSKPRRSGRQAYDFGPQRNFGGRQQQGAGRGSQMRGRNPEMMMPWAIDQSIPAIAFPLRRRMSSSGPATTEEVTWLIIQIDPNVLRKEIFPELVQKYFGTSSGMDYYVTVKALGSYGERVVYSSAPGSGEEKDLPMDASLNLFGPPFGRGGPPDGGAEFLSSRLRVGDHGPQADEQHLSALERLPRFDPFHYGDAQGVWQLTAKHKSGSVEAAVGAMRRRNLMTSFGVLGVLAITMGLIVVATQRARRLAKLQMDFVAGISHELRTPLAVISSAAENIAHGVIEDKQQLVRYGNTIVKQSRQLTQLVEQVLLFAATQQPQGRLEHGRVNVSEVIDAALEGTNSTVAGAGVTVERRLESGLPAVYADFGALVRSLQNLITNAVKYGGDSHWFRISATALKGKGRIDEVELTVEDKGIGIDKEEIKHIFEPFYRSPAVSESGIHGTGLGLPLARTIIEAMGGRISAKSELGKGSLFIIRLPVAQSDKAEETHGATDKRAGAEPGFSS